MPRHTGSCLLFRHWGPSPTVPVGQQGFLAGRGHAATAGAMAGCKAEGVNRDSLAASFGSQGCIPFRPLSVPIGATLLSLIPTRAHSAAYQRIRAGQGAAGVSMLRAGH